MSAVCPLRARLVDEVLGELVMGPEGPYLPKALDLGYPTVRAVIEDRTDGNGSEDDTENFGARAVTLSVLVKPIGAPLRTLCDALYAYMVPSRRPWLYYVEDVGADERRIMLRAASLAAPIQWPVGAYRGVQLGWIAPDGVIESTVVQVDTLSAVGNAEAGRVYPLTYPRVYPASTPIGTALVQNDGNLAVAPLLRLYGPATDPRIENTTYDQRIVFSGVVLNPGEYIEIDVREKTAYFNSDPTQSRYHLIDFSVSSWWELQPGANWLRYYPVTFSSPALAEVRRLNNFIA